MRDWRRAVAVLVAALAVLAKASAQDYRTAEVTFADGRTATWEVLAEAPGDLARRIVTRGGGEVDTVREIGAVRSLRFEDGAYFRQVRRPYRRFEGGEGVLPRLARRIVEGPASLYRLDLRTTEKRGIYEVDDYGAWTYYLEVDGELYELPQEESSSGGVYRRRRDFVGRLNYHLRECPELSSRLRTDPPRYRDADLAEVVRLYGDCRGAEVTVVPRLRNRPSFAGFVLTGGLFDVREGTRLPTLGARAALRVGRNGTTFVEAGLEYVVVRGRDGDDGAGASALVIPLAARVEADRSKTVRPFATAGLLLTLPGEATDEDGFNPYYITLGAGAYAGPARLHARLTPTRVGSTGKLSVIVSLTAGFELGGLKRPRRRVPGR